jgi:integrase
VRDFIIIDLLVRGQEKRGDEMTVFKPTYACLIPADAKIQKHKGQRYITLKDHNGRKIKAYLTKDGKRYLRPQRNWSGRYKDYHGTKRTVTLCQDKEASQATLNELIKNIDLLRAGRAIQPLSEISPIIRERIQEALRDSGQETKGDQLSRKPLKILCGMYFDHLKASGRTKKHRKEAERNLNTIIAECDFQFLKDICQTPVQEFVNKKKAHGLSDRTVNVYVDRLRYFCKWAVRNRLLLSDPFVGFVRLDEQTNRVREARSLTPDEVEKLLDAACKRPLQQRKEAGYQKIKTGTIKKLMLLGEERRLAYALMLYTGLRVNEVRQLIWADINIKECFVRVRPTTTKNSKSATLPLHSYLIELLKDWKDRQPEAKQNNRVVSIPTSNSSFLKVLNRDLEYAGIEKTDDVGRVVHLHALRHSFASLLARQGVHPHVLQSLARHSQVETTMNLYTHVLRGDDVSAIESLKKPKKARKKNKQNRAAG